MVNSINFNHHNNTIYGTNDSNLFLKYENGWEKIPYKLYKKIDILPEKNIGENGDYYAVLEERNNLCLYSNDFTKTSVWKNNNLFLSLDKDIRFPDTYPSTKIIPTMEEKEHSLSYTVRNDRDNMFTFSIFVSDNEYHRLFLSMTDNNEKLGFKVFFNLLTQEQIVEILDQNEIEDLDFNIIPYQNCFRIFVTSRIKNANYLKMKLTLVDNDNNIIFKNKNNYNGLFISGAQINKGPLIDFKYSDGTTESSHHIKELYKKVNGEWEIYPYKLYTFNEETNNKIGKVNDIATITSIIELSPIVKFEHNSDNQLINLEGIIYFDEVENHYYINGKNGKYKVMSYINNPHTKELLMATSLNNKTYQQWSYKHYTQPSFQLGYNTGSHCNFYADVRALGKRF